ncbi:MAG: glycosyltransferase, partial [Chloroflexi bacterium]|nr:glycosyltransferase [Chloroflexota bacterium]
MLFPGFLGGEERLAALSDTDLFVLTSQSENFGMAAAEAMLAGVPALLSESVPLSKEVGAAGC